MSSIFGGWHGKGLAAALAAAAVALALDYTLVDASVEPPEVISVSGCVTGCERTQDGLLLYLDAADDVRLFFSGLSDDARLRYSLIGADGAILGEGEGCYLPLEDYPSAAAVLMRAIDGGLWASDVTAVEAEPADWGSGALAARLSPVAARHASTPSALPTATGGGHRLRSGSTPARVVAESSGFTLLSGGSGIMSLDSGTLNATNCIAGLFPGDGPALISSLDDMLVSGNIPGGGAFEISATGRLYVEYGETFCVGADDYAQLSVGGGMSSVDGRTGFRWGDPGTVTQGGLQLASVTYGSYGGPYDFRLSGISDRSFYSGSTNVPYASLTADPATIAIPWEGTDGTSSLTVSPASAQVDYTVSRASGYGAVSGSGSSWTFTPDVTAFLRGAEQTSVARLSLSQSCYGVSGPPATATVTLTREEPDAWFTPSSVVVTPGEPGTATITGTHASVITYGLSEGGIC